MRQPPPLPPPQQLRHSASLHSRCPQTARSDDMTACGDATPWTWADAVWQRCSAGLKTSLAAVRLMQVAHPLR